MGFNYNGTEPAPWTISESNNHCVHTFEKLRNQREQGRFCDLILSVQGRQFPAHRCVLASCSPWFDCHLKVHKATREYLEVTEVKNYEIFHQLLTYCYTGHIIVDKNNVQELLHLSHYYHVAKLKAYCSEYLERNLNQNNCFFVVEMATKYCLSDLMRQSFSLLERNFHLLYNRSELLSGSLNLLSNFLGEKAWNLPQEYLLRFIVMWINSDYEGRKDNFTALLSYVNWSQMNTNFLNEHLEKEPLYYNSPETLIVLLNVLDRNSIYLGPKYQDIYQNHMRPSGPLGDLEQELEDSNSFLSMAAINSAVKDLEHSEVDPDWFLLQNEPANEAAYYPLRILPGPSSIDSQHRLKPSSSDFETEYQIVEQILNEQRMCDKETSPSAPPVKRFDPKFRALTEASRQDQEAAQVVEEPPPQPPLTPEVQEDENKKKNSKEAPSADKYYKYPSMTEITGVSCPEVSPSKQGGGGESVKYLKYHFPNDSPENSVEKRPQKSRLKILGERTSEETEESQNKVDDSSQAVTPTPQESVDYVVATSPDNNTAKITIKKIPIPKVKKKISAKKKCPESPPTPSKNQHHVRKAKLLAEHRLSKEGPALPTVEEPVPDDSNKNLKATKPDFKCSFCNYATKWKKELRLHIISNHINGPPFKCDICGYTNLRLTVVVKHRFTVHSEDKPFSCTQCSYKAKTSKQLNYHILAKHADSEFKLPCSQCSKSFASKRALNIHQISHTTEKSFSCSKCNFKTKYFYHFRAHSRIHDGTALRCHLCPNFVAIKQSLLDAHIRAHLNDKKFKCDTCGKGFVENSQLTRHKLIHSSEMPFSCSDCPYKTKRKDKLKAHKNRIHNITN